MSGWGYDKPPTFKPDSVATPGGWAHPETGELLVAIGSLVRKRRAFIDGTQVNLLLRAGEPGLLLLRDLEEPNDRPKFLKIMI